ncbi:hypothetical protein QN277_026806 [Acacia crassicarpa]|uniref:Uncharacterized protein n=1 Tax=Acacia crassicarpa TaxID=499986 RepID=A0AAE1JB35_9FABA|nr:hypothetical protein QN277_026806 [Acacia crassicarpa]
MAPQVDLAKIFGRSKSFGNTQTPQNLCQYKFYPTYVTATTVIQLKVDDHLITCNEAASRSFKPEQNGAEPHRFGGLAR